MFYNIQLKRLKENIEKKCDYVFDCFSRNSGHGRKIGMSEYNKPHRNIKISIQPWCFHCSSKYGLQSKYKDPNKIF